MIDFRFNYPLSDAQHSVLTEALMSIPTNEVNMRMDPVGGKAFDREIFASWLAKAGDPVDAENLFTACGGHNALTSIFLCAGLAGKSVVADVITYNGLKGLASMMHVDLVPCAYDADGMLPDALADICSKKDIKAVYLMPTVHNPLCITMPESRRREIVEVARKFDLLLIDDDAYGFLDKDAPANFAQLASERSFYVYSFAKPLSAGVKTSCIVAPPQWRTSMTDAIRMTCSGAVPLFAKLLTKLIGTGLVDEIINQKREEGAARQAIVKELMEGHSYVAKPSSFHFWLSLKDRVDIPALEAKLEQRGVQVVTSNAYKAGDFPGTKGIRVATGNVSEHSQIRSGLNIITGILAELD